MAGWVLAVQVVRVVRVVRRATRVLPGAAAPEEPAQRLQELLHGLQPIALATLEAAPQASQQQLVPAPGRVRMVGLNSEREEAAMVVAAAAAGVALEAAAAAVVRLVTQQRPGEVARPEARAVAVRLPGAQRCVSDACVAPWPDPQPADHQRSPWRPQLLELPRVVAPRPAARPAVPSGL